MKIQYRNQQDKSDPMNGAVIAEGGPLLELLNNRRSAPPFVARFSGDNGFKIMVGIGGDVGCVQYSRNDGVPPYLLAISVQRPMEKGHFEFLTGGTATPFRARNILSFDELKHIALHFLETGQRSDAVTWESI
jgi:hypothetical protein